MRPANLVGQTFEWLTVKEKIGSKVTGKTSKRVLWSCECRCGNIIEATTNELTQGKRVSCGCRRIDTLKKNHKTKIGDVYNYLVVKEIVGRNKENRLLYKCECTRCGGEITTTGKQLRNGTTKSCGCLKQDYMSNFGQTNFQDLTGKQFGFLSVVSRAPTKFSKNNNPTTMWNCKCLLCGKDTVVAAGALTTNNHTRSCGCMRMSYAEYDIMQELDKLKINYYFDYSFKDLLSPISNVPLRFDFALFENNKIKALMEYQGPQHYKKYSDGFGDFQREVTDKMKKEYCKKHNIRLFEIKYDEELLPSLYNILNTLYDNPVPSP